MDINGEKLEKQISFARNGQIEIFCIFTEKDEEFYTDLKKELVLGERDGVIVWLEIQAGEETSVVFQDYLQRATLVILLLSPDFFANDFCYMSMKTALWESERRAISIIPILARPSSWEISACKDLKPLPENKLPIVEWEHKERAYENIRSGLAPFINGLTTEGDALSEHRRIFQPRPLPKGYVPRPRAFDAIKRKVLAQRAGLTAAITTALRGAGGFGKTTLALALCHDPEIQAKFPDGIIWVELGEHPPRALDLLNNMLLSLGEMSTGAITLTEAQERWQTALQNRVYLLVIDDVWQEEALAPLLEGGQLCVRLITTRNDQVLPPGADRIWVDAMDQAEAIATLCEGASDEIRLPIYRKRVEALVVRLNCWPLLLTLARGMLLSHVHYGRSIPDALQVIENAYETRGVVAFDLRNENERQRAAGACLETSLRHLEDFISERFHPIMRYQELAIFDEDTDIPISVIKHFWKETGGLESWEAEELCMSFHSLSLLLVCDLGKGTIRLHDVMRNYLVHRAANQFPALHGRFLDTQRQALQLVAWSDLPFDERYLWHFLLWHLCRSMHWLELHVLLMDVRFLAKKILFSGVASLEINVLLAIEQASNQYGFTSEIKAWQTLHRRIVQISHLLRQVNTLSEIGGVLLSHLRWEPAFARYYGTEPGQLFAPPYLTAALPLPQRFSPALLRTLSGHTGPVMGCAISTDGSFIVSASADKTLKVWDASNGMERLSLAGHLGWVTSCAISTDGSFIVSASADRTLKVWDVVSGTERLSLVGHTREVMGCAISADGQWIISASADRTLRIWNAVHGITRFTLKGHTREVTSCAISADGSFIVSASADRTLKVWDTFSCQERFTLKGHTREVTSCAISANGHFIVSASTDRTLKLWNAALGSLISSFGNHTHQVTDCAISADGQWIVSTSGDTTLKVWSAMKSDELLSLTGHTDSVTACAMSANGKVVISASNDHTIKVWDISRSEAPSSAQRNVSWIASCEINRDGRRIVTASANSLLHIWDIHNKMQSFPLKGLANTAATSGCAISPDGNFLVFGNRNSLQMLRLTNRSIVNFHPTHIQVIKSCAISPDGRFIVSSSADSTLKVWDVHSEIERFTLSGHTGSVDYCTISSSGGMIVSASADKTLKVWSSVSGSERFTLRGHAAPIKRCAISADERFIVSASADKTLKVWDVIQRSERFTLTGHTASVDGCAISPDGVFIASASADKTLKIWNTQRGQCVLTFPVDGPLSGCIFSPNEHLLIAHGLQGIYFLRLIR